MSKSTNAAFEALRERLRAADCMMQCVSQNDDIHDKDGPRIERWIICRPNKVPLARVLQTTLETLYRVARKVTAQADAVLAAKEEQEQ